MAQAGQAARPSTATIAATPIAMPSADSPARSLRVRSPMLARAARSPGPSRPGPGPPRRPSRWGARTWWSSGSLLNMPEPAPDDEHLVRAMYAGATSYLLKTAPDEHLIAAARDAAAGTASLSPELLTRLTQALRRPPPPDPLQPLSPRERDVLRLIARGHSSRQIARDLAIGEQAVKTHVRSILTKLADEGRQRPMYGAITTPSPSAILVQKDRY